MSQAQFTLEEKLNESATTSVYKAHQDVLGRTVLLKILHKHLADESALVERFTREARACALIRSEFIVQVYDLTTIDGAPAIVMEFVEGPSLKDVLAREGRLNAQRTRSIAAETLAALDAAHRCGVIHRDIKPGNILVADNGHIKVTDFGLAAVTASPTVTMEGAVLGTPAYLPPEQIRGEASDERSDLFSLGATLLEVFTGQRIFEGRTYSACIHNILHFDPSVIGSLVDDAPLAELLKRLMDPDREKRFRSAREALDALAAGGAVDERISAPPKGTKSDVRPNPRRALISIASAAVILIAAVFVYRLMRQDGAETIFPAGADSVAVRSDTASALRGDAAREPMRREERDTGSTLHLQPPSIVPDQRAAAGKIGRHDSSSLVVTCIPWAKVFLDSQYLGETPISGTIVIPSGTHTVSFTNPQFTPIVKTVTASPGGRVSVAGNFFETAGYLLITVAPWAEVYIDDQYRDTTPIAKPIATSAGKRKLRLHNPGFPDAVFEVTVPKNDTLRLSYSLTRNK